MKLSVGVMSEPREQLGAGEACCLPPSLPCQVRRRCAVLLPDKCVGPALEPLLFLHSVGTSYV